MTTMRSPRSRIRSRWRAAFRLLLQSVALILIVFVAQQPATLPAPPPDVDYVEPLSHGQAGHTANRHRASNRAPQSPIVKRLTARPFVCGARLARHQIVAPTECAYEDDDPVSSFTILRNIPRMESDEPPRG